MILAFITSVKQRMRLLQESWMGSKSTQRLAQLLSTILDPDISFETNAPIVMNPQSDGQGGVNPPMVVNNWTAGDTLFTINRTNGDTYGDVILGDNGFTFVQNTGGNSSTQINTDGSSEESSGSGNVFPASVLSGGPGDTYTVKIYQNGRAGGSTNVTATHPNIDEDETIPPGTECTVILIGGSYEIMGVPTWL